MKLLVNKLQFSIFRSHRKLHKPYFPTQQTKSLFFFFNRKTFKSQHNPKIRAFTQF